MVESQEIEGFHIIKSILREVVDLGRVFARDGVTYFSVLLDDNNRKPICRLHFNGVRKKYIGLFDVEKNEEKIHIASLNDIYGYSDRIKAPIENYDSGRTTSSPRLGRTESGSSTPAVNN